MHALLEGRIAEAAAMVLSPAGDSGNVAPGLQPGLTPKAGQSARLATATMSGGCACSCSYASFQSRDFAWWQLLSVDSELAHADERVSVPIQTRDKKQVP